MCDSRTNLNYIIIYCILAQVSKLQLKWALMRMALWYQVAIDEYKPPGATDYWNLLITYQENRYVY